MDSEDEPVEYVRGFTWFLGYKIDLSKRPLIPRSETEFWVKKITNQMSHKISTCRNCGTKVLDIFAGSGCIGIAVLKHVKNAEVVFVDNDKKCVEQIKINLQQSHYHIRANKKVKNFKVVKSDIFNNLKNQKFDYVFANPPYVAEKNKHLVQKSVLDYEPHNALFGGKDGLFYIRKFLKQAKNYLNPNGKIFMEFSPEQKNHIKILSKQFGYKTSKFYKDQYGKFRWAVIR